MATKSKPYWSGFQTPQDYWDAQYSRAYDTYTAINDQIFGAQGAAQGGNVSDQKRFTDLVSKLMPAQANLIEVFNKGIAAGFPEGQGVAIGAPVINESVIKGLISNSSTLASSIIDRVPTNSPAFSAAKSLYDAIGANSTRLGAITVDIDQKISDAKVANDAKKALPALQDKLVRQQAQTGKYTSSDIAATQAAIDQANAMAGNKTSVATGTGTTGTGGKGGTGLDNFTIGVINNEPVVTTVGTTSTVVFIPPAKAGDQLVVLNNKSPNGTTVTTEAETQAIIKTLGGASKAAAALRAAGFSSGSIYVDIQNALKRYSTDSLQTYIDSNGKTTFPTMTDFLGNLGKYTPTTGAGKTTTKLTQNFTDRPGTDRDINSYMMENFGSPATVQQRNDYYNKVNAAERQAKTLSKITPDGQGLRDQVNTGSSLSPSDYEVIKAQVAQTVFKNVNAEQILNSKSPGKIAGYVDEVMKVATDYALPTTTTQALQYLGEAWKQQNPQDAVKAVTERLKQLAIKIHPTLADHIKANGTVKDIADTHANWYEQKMGVKVPDSTKNSFIMNSVSQGWDKGTFDRAAQGLPDYAKTPEAHQTVTDFTNTFLQAFGFGGN
jgi:hypothetical protein